MDQQETTSHLPLLKWPGGKRALVKHMLPLIPAQFSRYYEPFLGGAALFFALTPTQSTLADANVGLINCYTQIRDNPDAVIAHLSQMKNSAEVYYEIRNSKPTDSIAAAARLIYLTTLSFNGIHRVNLQGEFNVPYGRKSHLKVCNPVRIYSASASLSRADLMHGDFEVALANAATGDLVYLDPPYTVAHGNNGFIKYNAKMFSWEDQIRLADVAHELAQRGCYVFVSNASHPSIEGLYTDFRSKQVVRASVIAASARHRGFVTECIYYNKEIEADAKEHRCKGQPPGHRPRKSAELRSKNHSS